MKWLVYSPFLILDVSGYYPRYPKGQITPVLKWNQYRLHLLLEETEEFWRGNSKIDPVRGTYCGVPMRLLKADFTFGWDIEDFDQYDGTFLRQSHTILLDLRFGRKLATRMKCGEGIVFERFYI